MLRQVIQRILCNTIDTNFKVTVVAGRVTGRAHTGNLLSLIHMLTDRCDQAAVVRIVGYLAIAMVNADGVAITAHPTGVGNCTAVRRINRCAVTAGNIYRAQYRSFQAISKSLSPLT